LRKLLFAAAAAATFAAWGPVLAADQAPARPITTGSVKPNLGNGPADEKSLPSSAPAATPGGTTGATSQSSTVKSMNRKEQEKFDATGK
jgi:hypothetical protein